MASEITIGGEGTLFIGEDKTLSLPVVQADGVTPQDITGWTIRFVVRREDKSAASLIDVAAVIVGAFAPVNNPQRAVVTLTDDQLSVTIFTKAATYRHSWKRVEDGVETILAYGDFILERATQV